jgi:hypothetical protein|nr:MAG TPA: hypothetical protein [Caudoviricetes sp.]
MKVELQCGDAITIPEGCKAIVKDGSVVFEKEEQKEQEFKDGDVLTSLFDNKVIFIFKEDELRQKDNSNGYYVCHTSDHIIDVATKDSPFFCGFKNEVRLATENEKQFLFNKMKKQGLQWNAEEKRVETIRWRAKEGKRYYALGRALESVILFENGDTYDDDLWDALNYFRTKEQNKEAAKRVKETLRKYHEEIGE